MPEGQNITDGARGCVWHQMKQYIGTDIIEIARLEEAIGQRGESFLQRMYTGAELDLYRNQLPSLAARFAGKEAVIKVLGKPGGSAPGWKDIEILSDSSGRPVVNLYGKAKEQATNLGLRGVAISLSHSREYAVAIAIGET